MGTVKISLEEYNRMRDFIEAVRKDMVVVYDDYKCIRFCNSGEALDIYQKANEKLVEDLRQNQKDLRQHQSVNNRLENEVRWLYKKSIWEFIKWRRAYPFTR